MILIGDEDWPARRQPAMARLQILGANTACVQIPALPLISHLFSGKSLYVCVPLPSKLS